MYNSQETSNKIKQVAKQKNITLKKMLSDCGLGINLISQMAKGHAASAANLLKIADYLNVSVDYLVGRTGESDIDKELANVDFALYNETKELNDSQKKDVLKFVQFLKNKGEE